MTGKPYYCGHDMIHRYASLRNIFACTFRIKAIAGQFPFELQLFFGCGPKLKLNWDRAIGFNCGNR